MLYEIYFIKHYYLLKIKFLCNFFEQLQDYTTYYPLTIYKLS